jgi:hypothetical protein
MKCALKMVLASAAGGLALGLSMFLTFRWIGFGNGDGVLLDPATQSAKLIAVWTRLEPLPRILTNPLLMQAGFILVAAVHAAIYRSVSPAWPPGVRSRGLRLSALLYGSTYVFWEFFTPFNLLGEPLPLVGLELAFWALVAASEGFTIAAILERFEKPGANHHK